MPDFPAITTAESSYFRDWQVRPYNPAELWQQRGDYSLYDEMREDDQISAALKFKKHIMINGGFSVSCEDEKCKEFILHCIQKINFKHFIYDIMSAQDYGWSLVEPVWAVDDTPFGRMVVMAKWFARPPHTFEIDQDRYGSIVQFRQLSAGEGNQDIKVDPNKIVHYVNNPDFSNPYGESDLNRGVYTAWYSKKMIIKFYNMYLERVAAPKPVATYDQTIQPDDRQELRSAIKNLQTHSGFVVPQGVKLDFMEASPNDAFERAIDKYNLMIARALLFPDLLGMSGQQTAGGSYALGERQIRMFLQSLENIRDGVERCLNSQWLPRLLALNYASPPEASIDLLPMSEDDSLERAKIFVDAVARGSIKLMPSDQNWLRDLLGLEPVDESELEEEPEKTPEGDETPDQGDGKSSGQDVNEQTQEEYAAAVMYDSRVDYKKIETELDGLESEAVAALGGIIQSAVKGLVSEIRSKQIVEKKKYTVVDNLRLKNWQQFGAALKRFLNSSRKSGFDSAKSELSREDNIVDAAQVIEDDFDSALLREISERVGADIVNVAKMQIITGIRDGLSVNDIVARIDAELRGYDITVKKSGAKGEVTAYKLESIVRTNINRAYNDGRQKYFDSAGDVIVAYQFSAILDGRTTPRCKSLHGKIFRPSEAHLFRGPLHHGCRSLLIAITKFDPVPVISDIDDLKNTPQGYFK